MSNVQKEGLQEAAKDLKIPLDRGEPSGTGRPRGARGALPAIKTMGKKDLQTELGRSRKKIKQLEEDVAKIRAQAPQDEGTMAIPPELWGVFPAMAHEYLAGRFGDHWNLREEEIKLYGIHIERVAGRYLGPLAGENPELVGLALVVSSVSLPRALKTIKDLRKEAPEVKKPEDHAIGKPEEKGDI
jgi:hypothetical protein